MTEEQESIFNKYMDSIRNPKKSNKCSICGKPVKENTDGNKHYCQGHWILSKEVIEYENRFN
jgi:DNA-directed RNA polymerase subunit RPC12/RpoP